MTGKVFNESANVYQDQAKVLFDYYKAAAEKIVAEETENEEKRADLEKQIKEASAARESNEKKKKVLWIIAGVLAVAGIIGFFSSPLLGVVVLVVAGVCGYMGYKSHKEQMEAENIIGKCAEMYNVADEEYKNIRRDYSVDKIGVVYVPVATRVPFDDKSFLIDHTNTVDDMDFRLTLLNQPGEFQKSVDSLQKSMEKMPIVDTNEMPESINTSEYSLSMQNMTLHDYSGNIDRQVRNISYLLGDSEDVSVRIPVIVPDSRESQFISEHATTQVDGRHVVPVFDTEFEDKLSQLSELHDSRNQFSEESSAENTEYLKKMMERLAESVQIMSKTKNAGASNLSNYTSSVFGLVLKAGYNQYSPQLEAEEIEKVRASEFDYKISVNDYEPFRMKKSSEVKYDLFTGNWIAEDGTRTAMPFGMHQVDEEVLMPVIQALMEENRLERLKIYNNIDDQKRLYLDRWSAETNNYFRDNRQAADELINRMRETYADYSNSYNMYQSLQKTVDMMKSSCSIEDAEVVEQDSEAEMIAGFEKQAELFNERQEQFSEYMDRIMDDISDTTREFAHIEYYEGSLRDSLSHDTAVAMSNVNALDERKRQLLDVSPYMANFAELPPEPKTSEEMIEDVCIDLEQQVKDSLEEIERKKHQVTEASQEKEDVNTDTETEDPENVGDSEDEDSEDDEDFDDDEDLEDDEDSEDSADPGEQGF